jgi:hypothetical protein
MYLKNKNLNKILKEKGKKYVLTMFINWKINLTHKQLKRVLKYEVRK